MASRSSQPNPYEATGETARTPAERPQKVSVRWIVVPFFPLIGGAVAGSITFQFFTAFLVTGFLTQLLALVLTLAAFIGGAGWGLAVGIGFARGTHLR